MTIATSPMKPPVEALHHPVPPVIAGCTGAARLGDRVADGFSTGPTGGPVPTQHGPSRCPGTVTDSARAGGSLDALARCAEDEQLHPPVLTHWAEPLLTVQPGLNVVPPTRRGLVARGQRARRGAARVGRRRRGRPRRAGPRRPGVTLGESVGEAVASTATGGMSVGAADAVVRRHGCGTVDRRRRRRRRRLAAPARAGRTGVTEQQDGQQADAQPHHDPRAPTSSDRSPRDERPRSLVVPRCSVRSPLVQSQMRQSYTNLIRLASRTDPDPTVWSMATAHGCVYRRGGSVYSRPWYRR